MRAITQKIIRIGSSSGITIPRKVLKRQRLQVGDQIEITWRVVRRQSDRQQEQVEEVARQILDAYHADFQKLA